MDSLFQYLAALKQYRNNFVRSYAKDRRRLVIVEEDSFAVSFDTGRG